MDAPAEVTFGPLLLVGIGLMLTVAGAFVVFLVSYQRRLLRQQLRQSAADALHQQQLLAAVIAAQEAERERIGRDLHDDVASSISMGRMLVERLAAYPAADDAPALLALAREVLGTAVEDVRNVAHSLYPSMLARVGLGSALEHLAEVCRQTSVLDVKLHVDYPRPLGLPEELALYRICQELVHNTLKHAQGATRLTISLWQHGPGLTLTVEDDGCGCGPLPTVGIGLRSIGVRVQMLRAHLSQQSGPGLGTRTRIELAG